MKKIILLMPLLQFINLSYCQDNDRSDALAAMQKKEYATAEMKFKSYLSKNPEDDATKTTLVVVLINESKIDEAMKTLDEIDTKKSSSITAEVNFLMSKCYLLRNDKATAMKFLNESVQNGARSYYIQKMKNDKTFEPVLNDASYPSIEEKILKNTYPCMYDPNINELAFFVGYWNVFVSNDGGKNYTTKVAVDSVIRSMGGCSIIEYFNMMPPNNFQGRSFTFYDSTAKKVRHNWAGSGGDIYNYEVINSGPNMVQLLAINKTATGTHQRKFTMTFNPADSTLHQHIENSFDEGKTWNPAWDALFVKKEKD